MDWVVDENKKMTMMGWNSTTNLYDMVRLVVIIFSILELLQVKDGAFYNNEVSAFTKSMYNMMNAVHMAKKIPSMLYPTKKLTFL
jgi:hypothetical protein